MTRSCICIRYSVSSRDFQNGGPRREIDLMWKLPAENQCRLIAEGVALFRNVSGTSPRAFRAGCYGASELTLKALCANGIKIDSSYNLSYLGHTCGFKTQVPLNGPVVIEGVHEFPVTVFRVPGVTRCKPLEISRGIRRRDSGFDRSLRKAGRYEVQGQPHAHELVNDPRYEVHGSTQHPVEVPAASANMNEGPFYELEGPYR